jgi:hypothetical protein
MSTMSVFLSHYFGDDSAHIFNITYESSDIYPVVIKINDCIP